MMSLRLLAAWVLAAMLFAVPVHASSQAVILTARDGVRVHGQISRAPVPHAPVILAFHMAGSNHAEYDPLAGRLNAAGFTLLAIDQRSGGNGFGSRNKTVDGLGRSTAYEEALKDLEAALAWGVAEAQGAPILVWGSSYSAALVFVLAARHPSSIAGIVSFSPGEYFDDRRLIRTAAGAVKVPVFVSQSAGREEVEAARPIVAAAGSADKVHFIAGGAGVHGSSSLREDANPKGAGEYWSAVLDFLKRFQQR